MNVGKHTYGLEHIRTKNWGEKAELHIGAFCSIAEGLVVYLGGNHRTEWVSTFPFHTWNLPGYDPATSHTANGDVIIGNDVWIGANATIMSGITIGDGAVIGANSNITKNVDPYTIVGGNPAKLIRKRFTDEQIKKLLKLAWWNKTDDVIKHLTPYLLSTNIEELFIFVQERGFKF